MKFGQYELLEQIAVGGMAEVFKGRVVAAEGFEKLVAIKRILPDLAEDERFVKMLLTEARIHSALSHRNIVQIHDLGISEEGEYFIVLEYVEGYDLRVIMEQIHGAGEIIPEALSLHIAAEIAQGLHFAHELRGPDGQALGLVHRDVTPSNILISFAGEVKLSDFGLAKRRHDRSVVGSLKGNLAYMSPEQAKQAQLDRRTDVFSLGAILFELLTGKRLREITDEVAGWNQVASGVVAVGAPGASRSARAGRGPARSRRSPPIPAKRFPDAATFGAAIRNVLGDLSVAVGASDLAAAARRRHAAAPRAHDDDGAFEGDSPGTGSAGAQGGDRRARDARAGAARRGKTVRLADPGPRRRRRQRAIFTPRRAPPRRATSPPPARPVRQTRTSPPPARLRRATSRPARTPAARAPASPRPAPDPLRDATARNAAAAGARARLHAAQARRPGAHAARHAAAAARRPCPTDRRDGRPRHAQPRAARSRAQQWPMPGSLPVDDASAPAPAPARRPSQPASPLRGESASSRRRRARARPARNDAVMAGNARRTACSARRLRTSRSRGRCRRRAACRRAGSPDRFEPRCITRRRACSIGRHGSGAACSRCSCCCWRPRGSACTCG